MMPSSPSLIELRAAHARTVALYMHEPDIRFIDIGWKVRGDVLKPDEVCVRVHVTRKLFGSELERLAARRPQAIVSEARLGFPVDVIEGPYRLHPSASAFAPSPPPVRAPAIVNSRRVRPLVGGISALHENGFYSFATLGGIVVDRATRARMILSNWHVLAGDSWVPRGLRILQPAPGDGGSRATDVVGTFERGALLQGIDAAVARLADTLPFENNQLGIGPVSGVSDIALGMSVTKSGRSTGVTEGIVDGVDGVTVLQGRTLRHIAHIMPGRDVINISAGGDSGSWWIETGTRRVVGLHFAGSDNPDYALAFSMPCVLDALGVDVAL